MGKFDRYAFSAQPSFDEAATREAFSHAVPLKTLVIYCYDPRAAEIPDAVAKLFGDEVFPGRDHPRRSGNRVASSTTIFPVIVAGGRAIDALRSITVAQHLFGIQNIVVVHHSYCGATSFTADGIIGAYEHEHHSTSRTSTRAAAYASPTTRPPSATTPRSSARTTVRQACEHLRLFL